MRPTFSFVLTKENVPRPVQKKTAVIENTLSVRPVIMGKVSSSCAPPLVLVLRSRRSCDPLSNLVWHLGNWCPLLPRLAAYVGTCGTLGEVLRRRQPPQNAPVSAAKRVAVGMRKPVPRVPAIQHPTTQMRREHHSSSKRTAQPDGANQGSALRTERVF